MDTLLSLKNRIKNKNLVLLLIIDSVIIVFSLFLSVFIRFDFTLPHYFLDNINNFSLVLIILVKIFCFRIFALYRGMWRYTSLWDMFNIIKANILGSSMILFYFYFNVGFLSTGRSVFLIDFLISLGLISFSRLGIRVFFSHVKDLLKNTEKNIKKVIIIGAGDTGQTISRQLLQNSNSKILIVLILDDNPKKIGRRLHNIPVEGPIKKLSNLNIDYDEIYICAPSASKNEMRRIIDECKKTNKSFKTLPSISELIKGKVSVSQLREVSILDLLGRDEVELNKKSIKKLVMGKRVLITGAGGSIGSELVRQCLKYKPSLLVMLDISELNLFKIDRESRKEKSKILFKPILSDIRDKVLIDEIFEEYKPQIVFHAAAYKHVPIQEKFPSEAVKTNIFGTYNLGRAAIKNSAEKFVLVSTDKAVNPVNVMGATKRIAEIIMQNLNYSQNNTIFMAVRFGNVLGSSGSVIPIFKEQIKDGGPVTVTDPDMERYFMSIPEASQLIMQAGALGIGGEVFILDMGRPIKIIELAADLIRLSGFSKEDIPIEITGVRPGEKKTEELSNNKENLDKTKHEKIFVLNNLDTKNNIYEETISGLIKLEDDLKNNNPNEIRHILSSILKEYKPILSRNLNSNLIKNKSKAKA